jgi:hypothetical protein
MKYIKIDKYIISLEGIHGILHSFSADKDIKNGCMPFHQVILTYIGGMTASLDFKSLDESQKAFDKIGEALAAS